MGIRKHIFPNYKGYLIVLDNAKSHNNELIKNAITKSGNDYLFAINYVNNINISLFSIYIILFVVYLLYYSDIFIHTLL